MGRGSCAFIIIIHFYSFSLWDRTRTRVDSNRLEGEKEGMVVMWSVMVVVVVVVVVVCVEGRKEGRKVREKERTRDRKSERMFQEIV